MMDRRIRELHRAFLESPDEETHAELLRSLMRIGLIEERRILCAGFFGHRASAKVLPELIKRNKVIVGDKVFKTEELNDFIRGICSWPPDIWMRALVAAIRLAKADIQQRSIKDDLGNIADKLHEYAKSHSPENHNTFIWSTRRMRDWWRRQAGQSYFSRQRRLIAAFNRLRSANPRAGNGQQRAYEVLRDIGAQFKDKRFKKAMGDAIIPYLLEEYA